MEIYIDNNADFKPVQVEKAGWINLLFGITTFYEMLAYLPVKLPKILRVRKMEHIEIKEKNGWHTFWKAAGITAIAVTLIAIGFFGAMLVSRFWY